MYPHINQLCRLLHAKNISTFLVTNAQFPEAIQSLWPVTQLYVSIDAATPASLKAVDRPLFADYWERFIGSLKALREKKQRTTCVLVLVLVLVLIWCWCWFYFPFLFSLTAAPPLPARTVIA